MDSILEEGLDLDDCFTTNLTLTDVKCGNNSINSSAMNFPVDIQFNSVHVITISVYSVLFVLSALGNLTLLSTLVRHKNTRTLSRKDILLIHLTIADLIVTFFTIPQEISLAVTASWKSGDLMCHLLAFSKKLGLFLTGFVLVCMALDRYLAVRYPLRGIKTTKRAKWMVVVSWALSITFSIPQIFIFHVEAHSVYTRYFKCVAHNVFPNTKYELMYNIFVMTMTFILPFTLLVVLHGSIAVHIRNIARSGKTNFETTDGLRRIGADNIERARVRSIQMTFVVTVSFLICWTPYYFLQVWYWVNPEGAKLVDQRIQKILLVFAGTNSTVNPLIYGVFRKKSICGRASP